MDWMETMPSKVSTVGGNQSVDELRRELAEAREQQAATAEILASISATDANQVFAKIAASAAHLCDAQNSTIVQRADDHLRLVARYGPLPTAGPIGEDLLPLTRVTVTARAVIDRKPIHVADLQAEIKEYPEGSDIARRLGHRTIVAVPLMCAGKSIGAIMVRRTEVRRFSDRQIELLKTFADQAVIAIENTRLFEAEQASKRELTEALEQQTATSQVLEIISSSPGELERVFQTMLEKAVRICDAKFGTLFRYDEEGFHRMAGVGTPPALVEFQMQRGP